MSATSATRFEQLLSSRAQLGRQTTSGVWPTVSTKYEFGGGKPDPGSFPYDAIVEATGKMMAAEGAQALTYGEALGYRGMRELIAHKHELFEGLKVDPDNILVANGSGHALSLVISAFVDIGDAVICEAPTFSGTLNALRRHGADLHGVPVDDEGIVVEAVREKLEELRRAGRPCKLIYTLPTFHNPAGPTATIARRKALVALAQEYGTMILEDDAYGELRFEGETLPSLYDPRRGDAPRLAPDAEGDPPLPASLQLRRRRGPVHLARCYLLHARPHAGACRQADRCLPQQARRDAPGAR